MAEAKVSVEVSSAGLEAAMANFQRFSGSASSVQRAMGQFGRMGEEALKTGGALTPEQYDRMGQALSNIKRIEADITKQVADRRAQTDAMMQQFPAMAKWIENIKRQGGSPLDAIRAMSGQSDAMLKGMGMSRAEFDRFAGLLAPSRDEERLKHLQGAMPHAQEVFDKIGRMSDDLPRKLDMSFDRFLRGFGRVMTLTGLGTATAIAAQGRNRAVEYAVRAADISAFIGSRANAHARGLTGAGDFGVNQMEALDLVESIGSAGGPVDDRTIAKMAGMGLHFGLGRTGFAHMGREAVGRGSFNNLAQFSQFGATAGVLARSYGLDPAQRMFFMEANKNQIEQQTRWYGGRPLSVENYFTGINTMMMAMRHLNLPAGGGPIATQAIGGIMQALSPVGKSFSDVITQGTLMGLKPVPGMGLYLGMQRAIADMMKDPAGFLKAMQGIAGSAGIKTGPGANIEGDQLTAFMGFISSTFPGLLRPIGELNTSGVNIGDLLSMDANALPADLTAKMQGILDETKKAAEENWRRQEINWTVEQIRGIGGGVKWLEEKMKGIVGPNTAAGLSVGASAGAWMWNNFGSAAGSYFGAKYALRGALSAGSAISPELATALGWGSKILGAAGIAALPFTMSGEGMGTTPPKSRWTGNRPMSREEFVQLSEMARKGMLPELSGAQRGERPPIAQETLVDALIGAFQGLMIKIGELSLVIDAETKSSSGARAVPEKRSYQTVKPGGAGR